MNGSLNKPKGFGQILDQTFRLSKQHFKTFFLVFLTLVGPFFLLQALIGLLTGTSFLKEASVGTDIFTGGLESWANDLAAEEEMVTTANVIGSLLVSLITFISFLIYPAAQGAIIFAVDHIRKGESFTYKQILKESFSRYGPLLGSSLLIAVIAGGMTIIPMVVVAFLVTFGSLVHPIIGILMSIVLFTALFVGVLYFMVRWGFGVAVSAMEKGSAPGLGRSWHLTKRRSWTIVGLFLIYALIIGIITAALELTLGLFLGNSVVYQLLVNLVTLFTTMVISVGYAIIYFDLKIRNDGDDLDQLIDEYETV
ncbi:hypothetical protein [Rossellomorea marisflavi]|uniref:hypothetical protein n=1 Tax=Rossellomorea TaxID=2837508 RepID=UPI00064EA967|nr:hypothetical protein [Rossellomorea marisflavi]KMK92269.1 hypothetical protein VL03_16510 [Rossellomorea marisflavi]KML08124.1 hypothetical protein VL06_01245 [Rossellomorea marisflavi]KML34577.1 hypothetical protein VL12_04100 [Rossellomorea marisflavi]QHA34841.1 hypothetical protein D5E69_02855 [Rossellomorea marisflavi]TYO69049.1 EscU/YscU/HrcU family type III secretion system export apparatus switch protein [Rossellomorea marisflavi]